MAENSAPAAHGPSPQSGQPAASDPVILLHNDLSALALGPLPFYDSELSENLALPLPEIPGGLCIPVNHPAWAQEGCFKVIERGLGKYVETAGGSPECGNRLLIAGEAEWTDYRLRAVVTPLSFDDASPAGGMCGIVARYENARNYAALVLDRDGQVKLLECIDGAFHVLQSKALEFCLGQSLTLTLAFSGEKATGTAGPYSGATTVEGVLRRAGAGKVGFLADVAARFGPFTVEASPAAAAGAAETRARGSAALLKKRAAYPKLRLERSVPLRGLVNGRNLRVADVNGDGKPEIVLAQGSPDMARRYGMSRLTCLSVLDLDGKLLWQAGLPDPQAPLIGGDLPFQAHDLFGKIVACVFGYDVQLRDGKTGRVLFSARTPETSAVGFDFKEVARAGGHAGGAWGDESLNMNVAALAFCNTQGNGEARELILKDDHFHLAVLDIFTDPPLQQLFRHRGNHGRFVWNGDLDGDGKDELIAGYSLIDDDGRRIGSLSLGDFARGIAVLDPLNPGGPPTRIAMAAGDEGLALLNVPAAGRKLACTAARQGHAARLGVAKFRGDLPGVQFATVGFWGNPGLYCLYDATGKRLWSKELPALGAQVTPVNWTGRPEELLLYSLAPGAGLLDGHGDLVVEAPGAGPFTCCDTSPAFSADGRDSILAWDAQALAIYVPADAPLKGPVYRPRRPGIENSSNYRAQQSLP